MLTLSAIKADVGSIGGHTRPSDSMIEANLQFIRTRLEKQTPPPTSFRKTKILGTFEKYLKGNY